MKILHIIASPKGERSKSIELGNYAIAKLGGEVTTTNIFTDNVPYLSESVIGLNYGYGTYEALSSTDKSIVDTQSRYINDLLGADTLVISVPMWNFGMPGALKAWFDLIIKVNTTFSMEAGAYKGLVHNIKRVIVVGARGGVYQNTAYAGYDMLEPQVRGLLGFIGITNVETYWLEGVNATPDKLEENMNNIKAKIHA